MRELPHLQGEPRIPAPCFAVLAWSPSLLPTSDTLQIPINFCPFLRQANRNKALQRPIIFNGEALPQRSGFFAGERQSYQQLPGQRASPDNFISPIQAFPAVWSGRSSFGFGFLCCGRAAGLLPKGQDPRGNPGCLPCAAPAGSSSGSSSRRVELNAAVDSVHSTAQKAFWSHNRGPAATVPTHPSQESAREQLQGMLEKNLGCF